MSVPVLAGKRVVVVRSSALPLYEQALQGFKRCTSGEIVGDVTLEGEGAGVDKALAEAKGKSPDLLLTLGGVATHAVRSKAPGTPSLFAMVIDPGFNRMAPPGVPLDMKAAVQVEFIQKNFPTLKRIGVLHSPDRNKEVVSELRELQSKGVAQVILTEVSSIDKLDAAVQGLVGKADCILMLLDPTLYTPQTAPQLILQTLQRGLPIIAASPAYVKAGALAGIYANAEDNGCTAAQTAERIFEGEKPAAIPFSWSTKYKVAVNMVVADRLKITVSPAVINNAEQVIK